MAAVLAGAVDIGRFDPSQTPQSLIALTSTGKDAFHVSTRLFVMRLHALALTGVHLLGHAPAVVPLPLVRPALPEKIALNAKLIFDVFGDIRSTSANFLKSMTSVRAALEHRSVTTLASQDVGRVAIQQGYEMGFQTTVGAQYMVRLAYFADEMRKLVVSAYSMTMESYSRSTVSPRGLCC